MISPYGPENSFVYKTNKLRLSETLYLQSGQGFGRVAKVPDGRPTYLFGSFQWRSSVHVTVTT